ncbi:MAG: Nif3-like dinuclear metal center hexameric protein [Planctomycetaceae bacterium]|nr:Nif3-like dinuclear metal center hexameric protein [Planctomycetaceae bacterium]
MSTIDDVSEVLRSLAPPYLAEEWDNVGLLVGDGKRSVKRIMTCLTVTRESAREAIDQQVELIVAHHPIPFRPLKRLTTEDTTGQLLLSLINAGISVYSPHTAFDSARDGINQRLAEGLELLKIQPLQLIENDPDGLGAGRWGELAEQLTLEEVGTRLKQFLRIRGLHMVGTPAQPIQRVAVACGSAGQFLAAAQKYQCDLLVTGETSFHTCLASAAAQVAMLLPGHYASERFAVESLAESLGYHFPALVVWASREEADPLQWI